MLLAFIEKWVFALLVLYPSDISPYDDNGKGAQPPSSRGSLKDKQPARMPLGDITETVQSDHPATHASHAPSTKSKRPRGLRANGLLCFYWIRHYYYTF